MIPIYQVSADSAESTLNFWNNPFKKQFKTTENIARKMKAMKDLMGNHLNDEVDQTLY